MTCSHTPTDLGPCIVTVRYPPRHEKRLISSVVLPFWQQSLGRADDSDDRSATSTGGLGSAGNVPDHCLQHLC